MADTPGGLLISIDPGIDITGLALWDLSHVDRAGITIEDKVSPALLRIESIRTEPRSPLFDRLSAIANGLCIFAKTVPLAWGLPISTEIVIEVPSDIATYARHREHGADAKQMHGAMMKLALATGALVAAAHLRSNRVHEHRPPLGVKKARKQAIGKAIIKHSINEPSNEDTRSAVYIGAHWITTRGSA